MGEDYHTRLPNDMARGVDQYATEHDVTNAETLRRAVSTFLEEEGYPKELATDGGHNKWKKWAAARAAKWADRSMYATLLSGILGVGIGVPTYLNWVEPTVPVALVFISAYTLMGTFALVGLLLSLVWIGLYLSMGVELREVLPWRRPA